MSAQLLQGRDDARLPPVFHSMVQGQHGGARLLLDVVERLREPAHRARFVLDDPTRDGAARVEYDQAEATRLLDLTLALLGFGHVQARVRRDVFSTHRATTES